MNNWLPKVSKNTLLVIAGLVWLFAGGNILRIGLPDMTIHWQMPFLSLIAALVVFTLFFMLIFRRMVRKHSARILQFEEQKVMVLHFFDKKSYCIMIFMITFGILLRSSGWIDPLYLGTFYTGLGASLVGAGFLFLLEYGKNRFAAA